MRRWESPYEREKRLKEERCAEVIATGRLGRNVTDWRAQQKTLLEEKRKLEKRILEINLDVGALAIMLRPDDDRIRKETRQKKQDADQRRERWARENLKVGSIVRFTGRGGLRIRCVLEIKHKHPGESGENTSIRGIELIDRGDTWSEGEYITTNGARYLRQVWNETESKWESVDDLIKKEDNQ